MLVAGIGGDGNSWCIAALVAENRGDGMKRVCCVLMDEVGGDRCRHL